MSSLKQITQDIIADINKTLELASDACNGSPLQEYDANRLQESLDRFPEAGWKAQEAWDMHVEDERLKDLVSTLIEASDRISAVYTMVCDIVPARDARNYDYYTVSMVLPYLTFSLDALSEIEQGLKADLEILRDELEPVDLSQNVMLKRIVRFADESLSAYASLHSSELVAGFRKYVLQSLHRFEQGEEAEPFEFAFEDICCQFDGTCIEMYSAGWEDGDSITNWSLTIFRNGDVNGSIESEDLELSGRIREGLKLSIGSPDEYFYTEEE